MYYIIHNYSEGTFAQTDDIDHAGMIVDALMRARPEDSIDDFWVRADDPVNGSEYYWDQDSRTVYSASCFA